MAAMQIREMRAILPYGLSIENLSTLSKMFSMYETEEYVKIKRRFIFIYLQRDNLCKVNPIRMKPLHY